MTKILAIDTATEACSAALQIGDQILSRYQVAPQGHTQLILPMVASLLDEAGIELADLEAIAFGRGPGSFTGVRIGIGIAQGLALGAGLPLLGISNLACLAEGARRRTGASRVVCAIDARMNEVYWGAFSFRDGILVPEQEEAVLPPAEAAARFAQLRSAEPQSRWCAIGTGFGAYGEALASVLAETELEQEHLPQAQDMLPLALVALAAGEQCDPATAQPVYLRDKVTWKKLPGRE